MLICAVFYNFVIFHVFLLFVFLIVIRMSGRQALDRSLSKLRKILEGCCWVIDKKQYVAF